MERQIRKKWDSCLPDIEDFFFFFFERMRDTDDSVNLLKFLEDSQKYFEELLVWKETKKEFHLPIRNFKPKRHEKVHETAKPIGW